MSGELEGRVARLEAGAGALESRVTRVENSVQKVNDDQQDFYKHAWPPVQTALQTMSQLSNELVGLRADIRRFETAINASQVQAAALPAQITAIKADVDKLANSYRESQQTSGQDVQRVQKFMWMVSGGLVVVSIALQVLLKLWK
jgi:predicted  nucleic acid-binding Zn-ribbon protein